MQLQCIVGIWPSQLSIQGPGGFRCRFQQQQQQQTPLSFTFVFHLLLLPGPPSSLLSLCLCSVVTLVYLPVQPSFQPSGRLPERYWPGARAPHLFGNQKKGEGRRLTKQQRKRGRERDKGKERESSSCETVTSFSSLTHCLHLTRLFGNILEIWIFILF